MFILSQFTYNAFRFVELNLHKSQISVVTMKNKLNVTRNWCLKSKNKMK